MLFTFDRHVNVAEGLQLWQTVDTVGKIADNNKAEFLLIEPHLRRKHVLESTVPA